MGRTACTEPQCLYKGALYLVHWVYNYTFRPCILAIVRLYCNLNKQLYIMCVGYCEGKEISFPPKYPTHILYSCLLSLQYNLTMANIQGRNMQFYTQCTVLCENTYSCVLAI
jgi:hypothetical protein